MYSGPAVLRSIAGLLFFVAGCCHAADPAASAPAQAHCPDLENVRVDGVTRVQTRTAEPADSSAVALRDEIRLRVGGLETLIRRAKCKTGSREIVLFLDGRPVPTLEALWRALWQGAGSRRAVQLEIERGGQPQTLTVHTVDRAATLRRAEGV